MNATTHLLEALSQSDLFQTYERGYTEMTGMPVALRPVESWQLPFHGRRRENSFCSMMAAKSRTCAACLQTQERLAQSAANGPATVVCPYGLCECAVPVKLGQQTVGFLQSGQVLRQAPTGRAFRHAVGQARKLGVNIDNAQARQAFFATPVVAQKKLDSAANLLSIFAEHLAIKGNQIAVRQAHAEPPVITRAKQFIVENAAGELSLGQVARAVNTSVFHFCKLFKKVTGINFTEFVARTRVEKAKDLLLNPNLRVSEIAFEVGFQSLTHFNRVFKKIAGDSPTGYRLHLPRTV